MAKETAFPQTYRAMFGFFVKTSALKTAMFDVVDSGNPYAFKALFRCYCEHYLKFTYIFVRFLRENSDDVGREYFSYVMVFSDERDARRMLDVLPERLGQYGLTLHPTKTRLLAFRPPSRAGDDDQPRDTGQRSFDFLGFTHHWARSRRGSWVVKRKTASSRFSRALKRASEWFRKVRHQPVAWQHEQLVRKLRGHDNYYGIVGNSEALYRLRYEVSRLWRKWLDRRSHKARMTWARFQRLLARYPLPRPAWRAGLSHCAANP